MPNFIKLPSGRIVAPAHILEVTPDADTAERISVHLSDGTMPVFIDSDARALMAWWDTTAVEVN